MTAPDPRLGEIEGRLSRATPGPWAAEPYRIDDEDGRIRVTSPSDNDIYNTADAVRPDDAEFIAAAPTDVAYLLAELRKAQDALGRVEGLAAMWTSRGEHDMAYSKTIPDEDIAIAILADGATKVENARHIRAAVAAATGGDK